MVFVPNSSERKKSKNLYTLKIDRRSEMLSSADFFSKTILGH